MDTIPKELKGSAIGVMARVPRRMGRSHHPFNDIEAIWTRGERLIGYLAYCGIVIGTDEYGWDRGGYESIKLWQAMNLVSFMREGKGPYPHCHRDKSNMYCVYRFESPTECSLFVNGQQTDTLTDRTLFLNHTQRHARTLADLQEYVFIGNFRFYRDPAWDGAMWTKEQIDQWGT